MRARIRYWLIDLANKIGGQDFYQFEGPITGMLEHKGKLVISTKRERYEYEYDGKKFTLI